MEYSVPIISVLGSIIIAAITYYLTKIRERESEWRKVKLGFYIDFIDSLSGITECEQTPENDMRFAKACNNLYLFAPSEVISALKSFQDEVRITNPNPSMENYTAQLSKLVSEIRKDIKISDNHLHKINVRLWTSGHCQTSK